MVARNPDLVDTVPFSEAEGELAAAKVRPPAPASYGKFVALDVIGRGGMGVVLRARDPDLDRTVAIKLLAPERWRSTSDSIGASELQREGQALAKLSHPNVVTIYEMGRVGDQPFIAMELVDGVTLRVWLGQRARSWREIVHAFVECGRGLAAAHAVGLVHRDFKPENVLVGSDGRPRVTDFGLVTSGVAADDRAALTADGELAVGGAIVGTPGYMAPEQWTGSAVDARTDQFAFCVALWEALCRERPFTGTTTGELRDQVLITPLREPPRAMPRTLRSILQRGLARERDARWPSMDALLERLTAVLRGRRRWALAAGGVALVAAAGVAFAATRAPARADTCALSDERLAAIWTPSVRARVDAAIGAGVGAAIDAYAKRWSVSAASACKAARDRTLSPELVDKRTLCLEDRAGALGRLVDAVPTIAPAGALDAVTRLPSIAACDDLEHLGAVTSVPADPELRRRHAAIVEQIATVQSLRASGDSARALATAQAAVADARTLGHAPTLAAALAGLGDVLRDQGDFPPAEAAYRESVSAASDGHDEVAIAAGWIGVLFVLSEGAENPAAATQLDQVAEAAVRNAGNADELRYAYLLAAGTLAAHNRQFDVALARFTAAMQLHPDDPVWQVEPAGNLARALLEQQGPGAAIDAARRAAALTERLDGPDHPATGIAIGLVATILDALGQPDDAVPLLERELAIEEHTYGHDSTRVIQTLEELGNAHSLQQDYVRSRARLDDAIAIQQRIGASDEQRAMLLLTVGTMVSDTSAADALPYYVEARALFARTNPNYLGTSTNYAEALASLDRCPEAIAVLDQIEAAVVREPRILVESLTTRASCARDHQPAVALAALEHIAAICGGSEICGPRRTIAAKWDYGSLLGETGRDHARGRALVEESRAAMVKLDPADPLIPAADDWLRAHRR